jgi:hypothetical protein
MQDVFGRVSGLPKAQQLHCCFNFNMLEICLDGNGNGSPWLTTHLTVPAAL